MKKIFYTLVVLSLLSSGLFISSCKKVVIVDGHVATVIKIATPVGGIATTTTTTYTYNQYGQVIQAIQTQAGFSDTTLTTYPGYYFVGDTTRSNGIVSVLDYQLDAGLAIGDNGGNTYTYDNNGYLVGEVSGPGSFTVNTILNGNVTKSVLYQVGSDTSTTTYTYLTNRNYWNYGINFLGKPDQDLVSSSTNTLSQLGTVTITNSTYAYTYDGHGRVTQMTVIISVGGVAAETDTYTFTYTTS